MKTELMEYQHGDATLEAYVAYDDSVSGPRPAVLIGHDWTGRRDFATGKAEEIAELGYVAIAIDMYGKGVFGKDDDVEYNSGLMGPFATDRTLLRGRIGAALDLAKGMDVVDNSKIAAMGCVT